MIFLKILFIRHGETDWNRAGKIQGGTDIPLNAAGIRQAQAMRDRLRGHMPDRIISSPLQRALQTAGCIAEGTGIPIEIDERLAERGYGAYEGQLFSAVDFSGIWYPNGNGPAGIEPLDRFVRRVADAFRDLRDRCADQRVLVVSHGGVSIAASILVHHTPQNPNAKALYIDHCSIAQYALDQI